MNLISCDLFCREQTAGVIKDRTSEEAMFMFYGSLEEVYLQGQSNRGNVNKRYTPLIDGNCTTHMQVISGGDQKNEIFGVSFFPSSQLSIF